MDNETIRRLLPDYITSHVLNNPRLDFDPTSPCNIMESFSRVGTALPHEMAVAVSVAMRNQMKREQIKNELQAFILTAVCIHADTGTRCIQKD